MLYMFRDFLQDLIRLIKSSIGKFETYKRSHFRSEGFLVQSLDYSDNSKKVLFCSNRNTHQKIQG